MARPTKEQELQNKTDRQVRQALELRLEVFDRLNHEIIDAHEVVFDIIKGDGDPKRLQAAKLIIDRWDKIVGESVRLTTPEKPTEEVPKEEKPKPTAPLAVFSKTA